MKKTPSSYYLHIGDGGVEFSVVDNGYGPCIKIASKHLGNNLTVQSVYTTPETLALLGEMFTAASKRRYRKPGSHPFPATADLSPRKLRAGVIVATAEKLIKDLRAKKYV